MPLCGGLSEEVKDADDTVREICEKVRAEVEAKLEKCFPEFTPLKYRTQLVNGINYFVKVGATYFACVGAQVAQACFATRHGVLTNQNFSGASTCTRSIKNRPLYRMHSAFVRC